MTYNTFLFGVGMFSTGLLFMRIRVTPRIVRLKVRVEYLEAKCETERAQGFLQGIRDASDYRL